MSIGLAEQQEQALDALREAPPRVIDHGRTPSRSWLPQRIAPSNRLADLVPLMPSVVGALAGLKPGDVVEVRP